ncbi:tyrosine-type recombinase/integrase [Ruminococcus sp. OA3]|uniref:tyrosine-type recombinase/integrase n=1 Tax=Ruminococcus sp. OA3 TaxID=2914164 RepID=UPI0023DD34ED|nr:tyrosine-type recombinase/integrase [Ruminococcus sp. OA3]
MAQLRTRKRGKNWEYSFEGAPISGKRTTISKGGFRTKADAIEAGTKAKAEYDNAGRVFEPSALSVSDYMDYWMDHYVKVECKPNTQRAYSDIIRIHIKPYLGSYRLGSIGPDTLQEHMNKLYAKGLAKNYLKNIHAVLLGSFKYAVYPCGYLKDNPMQYVHLPKCAYSKAETDKKIITPDEFSQIITRFPEGSRYHILFMICYYTGFRIAECTGLTWDRIDLQDATITVDRILVKTGTIWGLGTPKTASSVRTIKIGDTLLAALKKQRKWQLQNRMQYGPHYTDYYLRDENQIYGMDGNTGIQPPHEKLSFVCTHENGTLINPDLSRYASRVVNYDLGIQFNFHSLRHTHATILIEQGADIKDVQLRLGHASLKTTMDTYVHDTDTMRTRTVDLFEKASLSTSQ